MIKNARKGFTLIEILIVVAIIAILASIVLVGLGPTQQAGRDSRRLGDLHDIQTGLELYYTSCGYYPGTATAPCGNTAWVAGSGYAGGANPVTTLLKTSSLGINSMPDDPTSGHHYFYDSTTNGTSYVIGATLENANESVFNTYTPPVTTNYKYGDGGGTTAADCTSPNYCLIL